MLTMLIPLILLGVAVYFVYKAIKKTDDDPSSDDDDKEGVRANNFTLADDDSFENYVDPSKDEPVVFAVLADWCPYCVKMTQSNFIRNLIRISGLEVYVLTDENKSTPALMEKVDAEGFPTVAVYHKGNYFNYTGQREDPSDLAKFLAELN